MIKNTWANVGIFLGAAVLLIALYYLDLATLDVELIEFYIAVILVTSLFLGFYASSSIAILAAATWFAAYLHVPHPTLYRTSAKFALDIISAAVIFALTFALSRYVASTNESLKERELERDLEMDIAAELQKEFVETAVPASDSFDVGYRVKYLLKLGGDLITADRVGGRIFISLADIAGKSLPATLFTPILDEQLRGLFQRIGDPRELLALLNHSLFRRLPISVFASLLLAVLEERAKAVFIASAGAEPPILYRADSGAAEVLKIEAAPVLGAVEEIKPVARRLIMKTGDIFVAFTDGFIGKEKREAAAARLTRAITSSAAGTADDIVDAVYEEAFRSVSQIDDASLVVVKAM